MSVGCTELQLGQKNRSCPASCVPHCQHVRSRSAGRPMLATSAGAGSAVCATRLLLWKPWAAAAGELRHAAATAGAGPVAQAAAAAARSGGGRSHAVLHSQAGAASRAAACTVWALPGPAWRANPSSALLSRRMSAAGPLGRFWVGMTGADRNVSAKKHVLGRSEGVGASALLCPAAAQPGPRLQALIGRLCRVLQLSIPLCRLPAATNALRLATHAQDPRPWRKSALPAHRRHWEAESSTWHTQRGGQSQRRRAAAPGGSGGSGAGRSPAPAAAFQTAAAAGLQPAQRRRLCSTSSGWRAAWWMSSSAGANW